MLLLRTAPWCSCLPPAAASVSPEHYELLYLRPRLRCRLVNSDRVVIYQPQHYISVLYFTAVTSSTGKLRLLNSHPGARKGCGRLGGRAGEGGR